MSKLAANITPRVLSWARESAGYSIEKIVGRFNQRKVTVDVIKAWEAGTARPSYPQFETLAKFYKRPLALFFLPEPPEEASLEEKFRSLPGQYMEQLPPRIRFLVRKARIRQLDLIELHDGILPEESRHLKELRQLTLSGKYTDVERIARRAREILGITIREQKGWANVNHALKNWRRKLEELGIWIFKDTFKEPPERTCDGFYLTDDYFPIIYINNSPPEQRQVFTLFHEFGHFLLSKGGLCFRDDLEQELNGIFQKDEVFCNAFAGEFLVPADSLHLTRRMPKDEEIEKYAKEYKVSKEVILRRCKDQGLIDWAGYNQRKKNWTDLYKRKEGRKSGSGGNYYRTQRAYLGSKYMELVFSHYDQKKISESQLADYLGVKVKSLPKFEAGIYQG